MEFNNLTVVFLLYNDKEYIKESLLSLSHQTFKNFNLLIIDDCSTDGSSEIALDFQNSFENFEYRRNDKNLGISRNMEKSLSLVSTKYLMWAGDDDLWSSDFIEKAVLFLESDIVESYIGAFGKTIFIDSNGKNLDYPNVRNNRFDSKSAYSRIFKLIRSMDDTFGYAVFRTKKINGVKFPIWTGENQRVAYNNIFPSLVYYLCKGRVANLDITWYNRLKPINRVNHFNHVKYYSSIKNYWKRRLELVYFTTKLISKPSNDINKFLILFTTTLLFINWFLFNSIKYSVLRTFKLKSL